MITNTILIDCTQIPVEKVGVGVYAENLLDSLFNLDVNNNYILIVQDDDDGFDIFRSENVKIHYIDAKYRNFVRRFYFEQVKLPKLCNMYKADILHSLHYSFPVLLNRNTKRVVTFHDMTFFIYPKLHTFLKRYYFRSFIRLGVSLADKIITVSKSTALDLQTYCPNINLTKVISIPLAAKPIHKVANYPVNYPYVVFIGTLEPRKNITQLIDAFSQAINSNQSLAKYKLYIVGKKGWYFDSIFEKVEELNMSDKIIFTGFVSDEMKFEILNSATLFVYPSFYEGFGLPVLEAMSLGIPTITSNISSLPEVAGNAAVLVDPNNVSDIANAIRNLLLSEVSRINMSKKGIEQSNKFSWELCAKQTYNLYCTLIKSKKL